MATAKKTPPKRNASAQAIAATTLGAPAEGMRRVLQVITKRDGFRRAGRAWHGTSTVPLDELTEEQFNQLQAEPMLVTLLLEVPDDQVVELAEGGEAEAKT